MSNPRPLHVELLYRRCDPAQFSFDTTAGLVQADDIIGQPRALAAIRFGIGSAHDGFNLFALGPNGVGKRTAVTQFLTARAPNEKTPDDWCYVNNFDQPHKPTTLRLPAGQGLVFSQTMTKFVEDIRGMMPAAFNSEEVRGQRKAILQEQKARESQAIKKLEEEAKAHNIGIVNTPGGYAFAPLLDGSVMGPEKFMELAPEDRAHIEAIIEGLQTALQEIMQQVPLWHRETQDKLKKLREDTAVKTVTPLIDELFEQYAALPAVLTFLDKVKQDVVLHAGAFIDADEDGEADKLDPLAPLRAKDGVGTRYKVNVLIDHSNSTGAPIVFEEQPTYQNLVGRVEHISQMGALVTDFSLIKAGALHRANGGYLILDAQKLLQQSYAWEGLKRALRACQIHIESLGQIFSWISTISLEPEPIPLDIKVVLTGERHLYYLLSQYDPDFRELFKVAADFENEMERDAESNQAYARLIANLAEKEKLRHFNREAVARVIEQSARLAEDATKLTAHMQSISDLLREADYWAGERKETVVTCDDVQTALDAQKYRSSRMQERLQEAMMRESLLIATAGEAIGQANGLSVLMLDNFAFGRPNRITASVRLGKGDLIDIERQVELGGALHSKGVLILGGFVGARYARERPLSLSASLVFEQSYGGVDGDSASLAELLTLLSAISDLPLKQSLAVTGSVNQHGQVQAVGGVNEKIEGFFALCQARGLNGEQGVLIPTANIDNLMLCADVVAAAEAGQFHIYTVNDIDEALSLMMALPAGELDADGQYPPESINGRIVSRLQAFSEKARAFAAPPAAGNGQTSDIKKGER